MIYPKTRHLPVLRIYSGIFAGCLAIFQLFPPLIMPAHAETLPEDSTAQINLAPDYSTFRDPQYLELDLVVTSVTPANVFDLGLAYDPDKLKLLELAYPAEAPALILQESIDNETGFLRLSGGYPGAGMASSTSVVRLRFEKLAAGWAELSFTTATILAADGLGTPIPALAEIHRLYLMK